MLSFFKRRSVRIGGGIFLGLFLLLQLAVFLPPFAHDNPPVTNTINWDLQRTRDLAYTACMDCHSNETEWPWYSWVAPASLLVGRDVQEGRAELNFSTDTRFDLGEIEEVIREGEMPPAIYTITHPDAALDDAEKTGPHRRYGGHICRWRGGTDSKR